MKDGKLTGTAANAEGTNTAKRDARQTKEGETDC